MNAIAENTTAGPSPILVTLDPSNGAYSDHDPNVPLVYWDDSAVTRGDGVFETLLVRDGRTCNLDRHFRRFISSAELLNLPVPTREQWDAAIAHAARCWHENSGCDGSMVWTYTRGRASTGCPSAWISVKPVPSEQILQRDRGVKVMSTPRGFSISTDQDAAMVADGTNRTPTPWAVLGAKTLSYAANMAALRYAASQGLDDVIYVSGDRVLEGATSTVVAVKGTTLRTPQPGGEILPGTTQAALFDYARGQGFTCESGDVHMKDLFEADSVWLVSSVRIAVRVTSIDGTQLRGVPTAPAGEFAHATEEGSEAAAIQEMITAALM